MKQFDAYAFSIHLGSKMKFLLVLFLCSLLAIAAPALIVGFGTRRVDDRALAIYHEKQGPFIENQTITFSFVHQMNGKYFTYLTLTGENLFVSWTS